MFSWTTSNIKSKIQNRLRFQVIIIESLLIFFVFEKSSSPHESNYWTSVNNFFCQIRPIHVHKFHLHSNSNSFWINPNLLFCISCICNKSNPTLNWPYLGVVGLFGGVDLVLISPCRTDISFTTAIWLWFTELLPSRICSRSPDSAKLRFCRRPFVVVRLLPVRIPSAWKPIKVRISESAQFSAWTATRKQFWSSVSWRIKSCHQKKPFCCRCQSALTERCAIIVFTGWCVSSSTTPHKFSLPCRTLTGCLWQTSGSRLTPWRLRGSFWPTWARSRFLPWAVWSRTKWLISWWILILTGFTMCGPCTPEATPANVRSVFLLINFGFELLYISCFRSSILNSIVGFFPIAQISFGNNFQIIRDCLVTIFVHIT